MRNSPPTEISQSDVDDLLKQLQDIRFSITTARESIAPLQANLAETYNEFQAVVGGLRRQSIIYAPNSVPQQKQLKLLLPKPQNTKSIFPIF